MVNNGKPKGLIRDFNIIYETTLQNGLLIFTRPPYKYHKHFKTEI